MVLFFVGLIFGLILSSFASFLVSRDEKTSKRRLSSMLEKVLVEGVLDTLSAFKYLDIRLIKILFSAMLIAQFVIPSVSGGNYLLSTTYAPLLFYDGLGVHGHAIFYGLVAIGLAFLLIITPRKSFAGIVVLSWVTAFYLYIALLLSFSPIRITNLSIGTYFVLFGFGLVATFWSIFLTYYGKTRLR